MGKKIKWSSFVFGLKDRILDFRAFKKGFSLRAFFLFSILILGTFLRFYRLSELAMFVGDQGRDYLVAKDIILYHKFPILGPQTSIPWIYLGPFFYYFLAFFLWLGKFSPVWPAYGTALFGVLAIYLIYILGKKLFEEKTGLIAAFFYAISPYAVLQSRIALHPSILPVFIILFLIFLFDLITFPPRRNPRRFGGATIRGVLFLVAVFLISVQLHLSAVLLIPIAALCWELIRLPKSTKLLRLFLGISSVLILLKIYRSSPFTPLSYWLKIFQKIFSYGNIWGGILALGIVAFGVIGVIRDIGEGSKLVKISLLVATLGLTVKNSQAEHYFNLFLPIIIIVFCLGLSQLWKSRFGNFLVCFISVLFLISNFYSLITANYFSYPSLKDRIKLAKFIVEDADGKQFVLKRCGALWDYSSTNMNYEYLVWWIKRSEGKEGDEGDEGKGGKVTYYIFEPKEAWRTKEGCEGIGVNEGKVFEFEQAVLVKKSADSRQRRVSPWLKSLLIRLSYEYYF